MQHVSASAHLPTCSPQVHETLRDACVGSAGEPTGNCTLLAVMRPVMLHCTRRAIPCTYSQGCARHTAYYHDNRSTLMTAWLLQAASPIHSSAQHSTALPTNTCCSFHLLARHKPRPHANLYCHHAWFAYASLTQRTTRRWLRRWWGWRGSWHSARHCWRRSLQRARCPPSCRHGMLVAGAWGLGGWGLGIGASQAVVLPCCQRFGSRQHRPALALVSSSGYQQ